MNSLIRVIPLLGFAFACASLPAGCDRPEDEEKEGKDCPGGVYNCAFDGDEGVRVTLEGAVKQFGTSLPATVTVCVTDRCAEATLRLEGDSVVCTSNDIYCLVREDGSLDIGYAVDIPEPQASVRVSVQNDESDMIVYEETKIVAVKETRPNGPECSPVCREAAVDLAAPPQSP